MIFTNYIRYGNKKLSRGERCLFRNHMATYLGSYTDKRGTVHMVRVNRVCDSKDMPVIFEHIEQVFDKNEIVCIAQEELPIDGQMRLC